MLVDCMAHLTDARIEDLPKLLGRAVAAGVTHVIHAGIDPHEDPNLPEPLPNAPQVSKAFGIHPMAVGRRPLAKQIEELEKRLQEEAVVALGELGLDRRSGMPEIGLQIEAFKLQLNLAKRMCLPVIIHCVQASGLLLEVLTGDESAQGLKGVWHGYTGSAELISQIENTGLHLSIGGMVTYEKAKRCRAAAAKISPERLLVESDSPDHRPVGWTHPLSEPAAIKVTLRELSILRSESEESLQKQTARNAELLFDLKETI